MSAMPALEMTGAGRGGRRGVDRVRAQGRDQQRRAMAPLTIDRMPLGYRRPTKPSPLDDAEDSKPYALTNPVHDPRGRRGRRPT